MQAARRWVKLCRFEVATRPSRPRRHTPSTGSHIPADGPESALDRSIFARVAVEAEQRIAPRRCFSRSLPCHGAQPVRSGLVQRSRHDREETARPHQAARRMIGREQHFKPRHPFPTSPRSEPKGISPRSSPEEGLVEIFPLNRIALSHCGCKCLTTDIRNITESWRDIGKPTPGCFRTQEIRATRLVSYAFPIGIRTVNVVPAPGVLSI